MDLARVAKVFDRTGKLTKYFILFLKKCYCILWSVEGIQKAKIQKLQGQQIGRIMLVSNSAGCDGKKLEFIKQQEAIEILSSLGIKTPLNEITLLSPLLFS